MSLLNCLAKLQRELRDFDTREVKSAAEAYRSRGREDQAANIAAIEDHLRELQAQRSAIERKVLDAWKERDPKGYEAAARPALELKGETDAEIRAREALAAKEAEEKKKRDSAPTADDFALTGSNRTVDVARSRGQMELGEAPAPTSAKNEDVGENLWYNRRNFTGGRTLSWDDVKGLNETLKVKEAQKARVWPKPDYAKLVEEGLEPLFARLIKQVYDGISVKPTGDVSDAALERYMDTVGRIRDQVIEWAKDREMHRAFIDVVQAEAAARAPGERFAMTDFAARRERARQLQESLLKRIWPDLPERSRWDRGTARGDEIRIIGANRALKSLQFTMDDILSAQKDVSAGWPASREAWERQGYQVVPSSQARVADLPEDVLALVQQLQDAEGRDFNARNSHDEGGTRYQRYTLPGGENYRELLLTLPGKTSIGAKGRVTFRTENAVDDFLTDISAAGMESLDYGASEDSRGQRLAVEFSGLTRDDEAKFRQFASANDGRIEVSPDESAPAFRSGHFDQPNILAHVRFDERRDADGKRVLFIEEIQSDWAQKGKREGFLAPDRANVRTKEIRERADGRWEAEMSDGRVSNDYATRNEAVRWAELHDGKLSSTGVPQAPFVGKTEAWVALAVKRMIRYAAENGFDRVAWTTGEQQVGRYDLSKHIDSVRVGYLPQEHYSITLTKRGERVLARTVPQSELPDLVGKELADKIIKSEGGEVERFSGARVYSGLDLRVGGEGMKAFYDKIVPNVVNDMLKKLGGGRVQEIYLGPDKNNATLANDSVAHAGAIGAAPQPGFDITPAMRERAMQGLPLFGRKGETGAGMRESQARQALKGAIENTKVPIRVVQSVKDLPFEAPADAKGAYYDGRIWAVADNLTDALDAERTIARHEVTHAGIDTLYGGGRQREVALTTLLARNPNLRELSADWRRQYGPEAMADALERGLSEAAARREVHLDSIEESLARLAESGNEVKGWQGFVATLQKGLRAMGLDRVADWLERATNAEALSFLDQVRRAATRQPEGTGRLEPAFARKGDEEARPFDAGEASRLENVVYKLQDKHVDTKAVLRAIRDSGKEISDAADPYLKEELFHGRAAKRVEDFLHHELQPLLQDVAARGVKLADLEKYLVARHAEEANAHIAERNPDLPDGGSGMTNAEAQAYLDGLEPREKRAFEALAKRVDEMIEGTRQTLVGYGLEGESTVQAWRDQFEHYVPLFREGHENDHGPGVGQGFSVRGSSTKARTGSTAQVADVLANVAIARERAIVRGEKNRVAKALLGLAESNPNPDFWKVDEPPKTRTVDKRTNQVIERTDPLYKSAPNVVMARGLDSKGNAIDRAIIFNEDNPRAARMAAALKNLDAPRMEGVIGAVGRVTRYFASINTQYNPVFGVSNIVRDVQDAMLNLTSTPLAGKQAKIAKYVLPALRGVYIDARAERGGKATDSVWGKLFEEFQNEGAQTAYRDLFRTPADRTKQLERAVAKAKEGEALPRKAWDAVFDWLSDYNLAMENSTRLAAYRVALESGMSKERAASLAKNLTVNFNRKGALSPQLGALYAFYNASAQGTARMMETLTGPGGKKIIGGLVALGVAQALALSFAGFDENEIPDFVKQNNMVIPIGGKKYLTIPMPKGFLFLPNLGRIATEFTLGHFKNPVKRLFEWMSVVADAFDPMGNVAFSGQTFAPTVLDPFVALAENKDWTGRPIAREDRDSMHKTPGYTRSRDVASAPGKIIAQGINALSGGTAYKPGVFSPTGDQIDYLVGQATGGVGREGLKLWQMGSAVKSGEDLPTYKMPLVGRFYGDAGQPSAQAPRFYDNLRELNEHAAELKGRQAHGESVGEYRQENPETRLIPAAEAVEREVAKLNAQKHKLVQADAPSDQVKALDDRIRAKMMNFNERVSRARATGP
jgi:hypothetical protein